MTDNPTIALDAMGGDHGPAQTVRGAIIAAAKKVGKPVCVMVDGAEEAADFAARGASAFIVSSDQGFLRKAAAQALAEMSALKAAS